MVRSPFTADFRPPLEPPVDLPPDKATNWTDVAEGWQPDDDAADRALVSILVHADQSTISSAVIRERLWSEARQVLAEHTPNDDFRCIACMARHGGWPVVYPCWAVLMARRVIPPEFPTPTPTPDGSASVRT